MKKSTHPSTLLLTVFGLGFAKIMPGTVTSIVTTFFGYLFVYFLPPSQNPLLIISLVITFLLFLTLISHFCIKKYVSTPYDRSSITVDEFIGQLITLIPLVFFKTISPWPYLIGLVLFRIFDIKKPFFIKTIDDQNTPSSVLLDDVAAGIISALLLLLSLSILPTW